MFDHHDGMSARQQTLERLEQHRHVGQVQAGGRFIKEKQCLGLATGFRAGQVPGEFQSLGFATAERRHRLAEGQIAQTDFPQRGEATHDFWMVGKKPAGIINRQVKDSGNRPTTAIARG